MAVGASAAERVREAESVLEIAAVGALTAASVLSAEIRRMKEATGEEAAERLEPTDLENAATAVDGPKRDFNAAFKNAIDAA